MDAQKGQALMLLLRGKGGDRGKKDAPPEDGDENYDEDMKMALGDLASALGVTVKDPDKAIEAIKTLHDLCSRAGGEAE